MIDIQKQIEYWRVGAAEEFDISVSLFEDSRLRHGLFFLHLTLEKIIKAHFCKKVNDLAPKSHNLIRLAELAMLSISDDDKAFLGEMTRFNIEGRYPDSFSEAPSAKTLFQIRQKGERIYKWLLEQLQN